MNEIYSKKVTIPLGVALTLTGMMFLVLGVGLISGSTTITKAK